MGRRKRVDHERREPPGPAAIEPNRVYLIPEIHPLVRTGTPVIAKALATGELQSKILGRKRVILGAWILAWLESVPSRDRIDTFRGARARRKEKQP